MPPDLLTRGGPKHGWLLQQRPGAWGFKTGLAAPLKHFGRYFSQHRLSAMAPITLPLVICAIGLAFYSANFQGLQKNLFAYWDMLAVISFFDLNPRPSLLDMLRFRINEHSLFIPLAFFQIDHNYFGGRGNFIYPLLYLGTVGLALFSVAWASASRIPLNVRLICGAVALAGFFWVGNYETLTWDINLAVVLSFLFLLASCWVATAPRRAASSRWGLVNAAVAAVFAAAASYCTLHGLAAIPAVLLYAVLSRWRVAKILVFLVVALAALAPLFLTSQPNSFAGKSPDPLLLFSYIGRLLSIPFRAAAESIIALEIPDAILISVTWLTIAMVGVLALLRGRRDPTELRYFDFALLLVVSSVSMAAEMGFGRAAMNLGTDSRYAWVSLLFWFGALGVVLLSAKPQARPTFCAVLGAVLLVALAVSTPRLQQVVRERTQTIFASGVAASLGIYDLDNYRIFIAPAPVEAMWPRPRGNYKSYRDGPPFGWLGRNVSSFPRRHASKPCYGHVDMKTVLRADREVLRVSGWVVGHENAPLITSVLLVDASGSIIGLARPGLDRPDVDRAVAPLDIAPRSATLHSGFNALLRSNPHGKISLWAVDRKGRVCLVEEGR